LHTKIKTNDATSEICIPPKKKLIKNQSCRTMRNSYEVKN